SKSSYNQTELTFTGMLYLDYFLDENSEKYRNIKKFYPQNLKYDYEQIPLIKLLDEINYKFFFIGNTRGNCETYIKKNCLIKSQSLKNLFQEHKIIFEVFLIRSPYIAIFNKIEEKIRRFLKIPLYNNNYLENDAIYKFIENIDKKNYPKKSFFLIHNLYPHSPYVYNKDCSQKKRVNEIISTLNTNKVDTDKGYYDNYICSIKKTFEFIKYLEKNDKDAAVIFQGDHGKYFTKDNKNEKLEIFNLVKKSNNCSNNISNEIDNINAVRYLLDCATNIKIELLEKKTFWGPYLQNDKNWGKLTKIN
ncbi:LTA synthase family protein, partial [Candidatus Pelagibacter sp.]|nr:LTA synthase family protein [Candidatus Pelagibacter sp.]